MGILILTVSLELRDGDSSEAPTHMSTFSEEATEGLEVGKQKKQRRKTTSTGTSMASIKSELRKAMRREAAKEEMRVLSALGVDVIKLEEYICQARKRCDEDRETQRQSPPKENKGEVPDADLGWYESTKGLRKGRGEWDHASLIRSVLFVPIVETHFDDQGKQCKEAQTIVGCVVIVQHKQHSHQQRFGHKEAKWLCNFCDVASRSLQQVCEVDSLRLQLDEARAHEALLVSRLTEVSSHAESLAVRRKHRPITGCLLEQTRVVLDADASAVFVTRLVENLNEESFGPHSYSISVLREMLCLWTKGLKTFTQRRQAGS